MPLLSGSSRKTIGSNISELEHSGYGHKQSIAIALKKAGKSNKDEDLGDIPSNSTVPEVVPIKSARQYDINGWPEIKGNPISKVGVFPYSGAQIGYPDLESDKIYMVYRPAEELSDPETINSFKLLPFTDGHAMLGSKDEGLMPAEKKGIEGVTGEDIYFEEPYLLSNLKIFSENAHDRIDGGIKEISIGYRCKYERRNGIYDGQPYDFIQRKMRGNHVANVPEGRSGPDVAVLDTLKFTFDAKDIKMPDMSKPQGGPEDLEKPEGKDNMETEREKEDMSEDTEGSGMKMLHKALSEAVMHLEKMMGTGDVDWRKEGIADEEPDEFVKKVHISDIAESEEKEAEKSEGKKDKKVDEEVEKEGKQKPSKAMDAKAIFREAAQRDALANKLSQHIGVFDHAEKTLEEVAQYGIRKLGLTCPRGHEQSVLQGYLAAAKVNPVVNIAQDAAPRSSQIDNFLKGAK